MLHAHAYAHLEHLGDVLVVLLLEVADSVLVRQLQLLELQLQRPVVRLLVAM
tara:strand:+ start:268 stop:423 length:156 start_codon:yes stop_codon:yes gene_type:complete